MDGQDQKVTALLKLAQLLQERPAMVLLLGFLTGRAGRVHFVEEPGGSDVDISITARRYALVGKRPFEAKVRGVEMMDPVSLIKALGAEPGLEIALQVDFEGKRQASWYQDVAIPSLLEDETGPQTLEERLAEIRAQIDDTLDIYNEARQVLKEGAGDREQQIQFYLERARNEMEGLSRKLRRLEVESSEY